jgi:hypothetical protein
VATSDEWWDAVTDGLADSMADVILASLAATNKLFVAAGEATRGATAMRASARRAALRVCLVMGPLVDTWRMLPSHAQVGCRGGAGAGPDSCGGFGDVAAGRHQPGEGWRGHQAARPPSTPSPPPRWRLPP